MSIDSPNLEGLERWQFEPRKIEKPWGWELLWAQTDDYVGKILFVRAGASLSLPFAEVHGSFTVLGTGLFYTAAADRAPNLGFGAPWVIGRTC